MADAGDIARAGTWLRTAVCQRERMNGDTRYTALEWLRNSGRSSTKSALKAYQADNGIKVDGTLSTATLNSLGISGSN
ncbi:peptidoglycan-binding domain-containing protein [Hydrocarboniphaga effusa]|jgi:hypothetical protein